MGLGADDPRPEGITLEDAYAAVRTWLQANIDRLSNDPIKGANAVAAKPYIESLRPPTEVTRDEMRGVLQQVMTGRLEWAYHESDGRYKMAAYASAALDALA
jgi:hypothetical protein